LRKDEGNSVGKFADRYRPERHYMRGPGPKWHAKQGSHPQSSITRDDPPYSLWLVPATVMALLGFVALVALA
jgi:hypothetical protein